MRHVREIATVAALAAAAACASTGQRPGEPRRDENLITAEELRAVPPTNLSEYIQSHRPRWLERNYAPVLTAARVQGVVVYVDNQEYGGADVLRTMSTRGVREVRYYSPSEAQARFGPGYINGVIQVVTSAQ